MQACDVHICEVGPRDGLQLAKQVMPTERKKAWLTALAATGLPEVDATSFVPPAAFPQFADGAEIVRHALSFADGWRVGALAPNLKGAERAIEAGVQIVNFVVSVSRGHNLANVRRTVEEQVAAARQVKALINARPAGQRPKLVAGLSTAFGCSIEGKIAVADVCRVARMMLEAGADEITLADTVGYADPRLIKDVVAAVRGEIGDQVPLRLHLHDTMGTGLANALAGLEAGITRFDAALGGLGGCPFAPGASGNIATEDLVYMFEQMGLKTGIDLPRLLAATDILADALPQERIRSHVREAGIPRVYGAAA